MQAYGRFQETQRFTDSWLGKTICISVLMICSFTAFKLMFGIFVGAEIIGNILPLVAMSLGLYILFGSKLITEIDEYGIHFQFKPFHGSRRSIYWEDIKGSVVRRYSPLREYGGWGLRWGGSRGWAYNVAGNQGLQLVLKNKKQILIGTQRYSEMEEALKKFRGE